MSDFKTDEFNGVRLTEYNGKYSIEALKAGKEDKFYSVWARYQKGKDELQEKSWPVKVNLGDREKAKTTLLMMLAELGEADVPERTEF
jgi:hypothetical protein